MIPPEALEAANHWNGSITRLIRNRENAVYEMAVVPGRAALRLHRGGYQSEAAIRSELWWCGALADAGVAVPVPLRTGAGEVLVRLAGGRFASCLGWVEGRALGEGGVAFAITLAEQEVLHHALGRLIAQVHRVTDGLTLPAGFARPLWDRAGLVGDAPFWGRFWEHPAATPSQAAVLRAARGFLQRVLSGCLAGADFGPIHADVLRENVLVNGRSVSLIDFDDSGMGFRLYDLGTVLIQNLYEPYYARIRDALIEGYGGRTVAPVQSVEAFTLARVCASVGWTMPRLAADDPINASHIARAVMWADRVMA